jgi:hypothetical protein
MGSTDVTMRAIEMLTIKLSASPVICIDAVGCVIAGLRVMAPTTPGRRGEHSELTASRIDRVRSQIHIVHISTDKPWRSRRRARLTLAFGAGGIGQEP